MWKALDFYLERFHMAFSSQESVISAFYLLHAYRYVKSGFVGKGKTRQNMVVLVLAQLVIIAFDVAMITIDSKGLLQLKLFIHSAVYSIKLELEFVVLNQLVEMAQLGSPMSGALVPVGGVWDEELSYPKEGKGPQGGEKLAIGSLGSLDLESQIWHESSASKCSLEITTPDRMDLRKTHLLSWARALSRELMLS